MIGEKKVIVTADDLGLSTLINDGIFESHCQGVVTSTALLVNAPKTKEAVERSKKFPNLQVGLHLGLVEGYSLLNRHSSISDTKSYFGDGQVCLHRDWRRFLRHYFLGKIQLSDLREEFEQQITTFLSYFPSVPFLNGTQHLHLLPGINSIVLDLCVKYKIPWVRTPARMVKEPFRCPKSIIGIPYQLLGLLFERMAKRRGVRTPHQFGGFIAGGSINEEKLIDLLERSGPGICEIMIHPGKDDPNLRRCLPWAYQNFDWNGEMLAAISPKVMTFVQSKNIVLSQFQQNF